MDWPAFVGGFIGSAIAAGFAALFNYLSTRSIEGQKGQQNRELLEMQNAFSLGTASHMATVAFDKYIKFCEAYVKEMYAALHTLTQDGGPEEALDRERFSWIREEWALWLTSEIENKLDRFEVDITRIIGSPAQELDDNGYPISNESNIAKQIAFLREGVLTEHLTNLRNRAIRPQRNPRGSGR